MLLGFLLLLRLWRKLWLMQVGLGLLGLSVCPKACSLGANRLLEPKLCSCRGLGRLVRLCPSFLVRMCVSKMVKNGFKSAFAYYGSLPICLMKLFWLCLRNKTILHKFTHVNCLLFPYKLNPSPFLGCEKAYHLGMSMRAKCNVRGQTLLLSFRFFRGSRSFLLLLMFFVVCRFL